MKTLISVLLLVGAANVMAAADDDPEKRCLLGVRGTAKVLIAGKNPACAHFDPSCAEFPRFSQAKRDKYAKQAKSCIPQAEALCKRFAGQVTEGKAPRDAWKETMGACSVNLYYIGPDFFMCACSHNVDAPR